MGITGGWFRSTRPGSSIKPEEKVELSSATTPNIFCPCHITVNITKLATIL